MAYDREITVDLWKTSAHSIEVGFKKDTEHQAKSRQYTKDTEIYGEISEGGDTIGYITYREDPWKLDIPNRKIIVKYFTKSMNWKASMEELLGRGIPQSVAAGRGLPSFIINVSREDFLVPLEKVQKDRSMGKDVYTFGLIDEKTRAFYPFSIEEDRMTMGNDWAVYDYHQSKIAEIDGKKFNVGGKYVIKIDTSAPSYHKMLPTVLILFAGINKFLEKVEKKMKETVGFLEKAESPIILDTEEVAMFKNPRMITM